MKFKEYLKERAETGDDVEYAVFDKDTDKLLSDTSFSGKNGKRDATRCLNRIWHASNAYVRKFTDADHEKHHGKAR